MWPLVLPVCVPSLGAQRATRYRGADDKKRQTIINGRDGEEKGPLAMTAVR